MASFSPSLQGVASAVDEMLAHRTRTACTVGGIATAVLAVVVGTAAVRGVARGVLAEARIVSAQSLLVIRWPPTAELCARLHAGCAATARPFTTADAAALRALPGVQQVVVHRGWSATVAHGGALHDVALAAWTADWTAVATVALADGRSFTAAEDAAAAPVAVVNAALARHLFAGARPTGATVAVAGVPLRILGVAADGGPGDAPAVIVPLETARRLLGVPMQWVDLVVLPQPDRAAGVAEAVAEELRGRRGIGAPGGAGFRVVSASRLEALATDGFALLEAGGALLALGALAVAGTTVLAGMMMSVSERTREIGVRRALGATRGTILRQFLAEGVTLATIGAVTGLIAGALLSLLVARTTPVPASVPPVAMAAALLVAAVGGLLCGTPAALRAARLDTSRLLGAGGSPLPPM